MVRTQIQLTEEQYLQLKQLALKRRRSLANLVREGVEKVINEAGEPSLDEARRNALPWWASITPEKRMCQLIMTNI